MSNVNIEIRYSPASRSVSSDVARDIARHHLHEDIVVITAGNPLSAHAAFRKLWMQVRRSLEKELAITFNTSKSAAITAQLQQMDAMNFTTSFGQPHSVLFATAKEYAAAPQRCHRLYITHPVSDQLLHKLSSAMSASGTIIRYLRPELKSEHAAVQQHPWRQPM